MESACDYFEYQDKCSMCGEATFGICPECDETVCSECLIEHMTDGESCDDCY